MIGWVEIVHSGAIVRVPVYLAAEEAGFFAAIAIPTVLPDETTQTLAWQGALAIQKDLVYAEPWYLRELKSALSLLGGPHVLRMTYEEIVSTLRKSDALGDCVPDDIEATAREIVRLFHPNPRNREPTAVWGPHVLVQFEGVTVDPSSKRW